MKIFLSFKYSQILVILVILYPFDIANMGYRVGKRLATERMVGSGIRCARLHPYLIEHIFLSRNTKETLAKFKNFQI